MYITFDTDFPGFINATKILDFFFSQCTKNTTIKCLFCDFAYDFFVVVVFWFSNPHHQEQVPCLITGLQVLLVFLFLFVTEATISYKIVEKLSLACVASICVWFRAKNMELESKTTWKMALLFHFLRSQNWNSTAKLVFSVPVLSPPLASRICCKVNLS